MGLLLDENGFSKMTGTQLNMAKTIFKFTDEYKEMK